ncbi:MAG: ribosome small subunit-dependent GTPase A [Firmicutes bacterium]|nr:ribosome small subunit-dependent GTPase A [Bacillota bacterium]
MPTGRIIRSIAGFYDVAETDGAGSGEAVSASAAIFAQGAPIGSSVMVNGIRITRCRGKGTFRKKGVTPMVGDLAEYTEGGLVTAILPRRNEMLRPQVSNVDQALVVIAATVPEPNFDLVEKMLLMIRKAEIRPVLIFNKWDTLEGTDEGMIRERAEGYRKAGFRVICTSAATGLGVEELRAELAGRISVFAGPSGVGKSSLLNSLLPDETFETGSLSEKIQRGRNTTRCAELIQLPGLQREQPGYLVDTPGFTSLDLTLYPDDLAGYFPEFAPYLGKCYYTGCRHHEEPDCAVREAVREGQIVGFRYESYLKMLAEAEEAFPDSELYKTRIRP